MKKILIVEDDPDINKALAIRLQAAGYKTVQASDGYLGLSAAVAEQPDLMILDISLPAGDGFSIVQRLQENTSVSQIPFLILTASRRPEFRQQARELGAYAFFEKPYESAHLLGTVSEAVAGGFRLSL